MKRYSQLIESLKSPPVVQQKTDAIREDYVTEKIFKIGDKVEYHNLKDQSSCIAEIIDRGPNYVTLVNEGKTFKVWLKDIKPAEIKEDTKKRDTQLYRESFIVKGYKTKNFTRELSERFRDLTKTNSDLYAIYNSVICLDKLLGINEDFLKEDFNFYKVNFDRSIRYLKKFNMHLDEMSKIEDILLAYSIEEGVKFSAFDKSKVATIIANTVGIEGNPNPVATVNAAVKKFKSGSHSPEGWKIFGRMLQKAEQAGIKWDKSIFAKPTLKYMEIEE